MKVWIVSLLFCAVVVQRTTSGEAVVAEHENDPKLPEAEDQVQHLSPADADIAAVEEMAISERIYCPPGWVSYRSRCFQVVRSLMSWINAENHCVSLQASLASIQHPDEDNFLRSLITSAGLSQAWIGGYNFQSTWLWIDRAGFYYSNWYSLTSVSSYPCAYIRSNAGWSNTNCASSYPFICSIGPTTC